MLWDGTRTTKALGGNALSCPSLLQRERADKRAGRSDGRSLRGASASRLRPSARPGDGLRASLPNSFPIDIETSAPGRTR